MWAWLKTVNKANIAAALAFVSPLFAKWFGIEIPLEVQGGIAAVVAWLLAYAVANAAKAGTAVVEVKNLTATTKAEVIQRADKVGSEVTPSAPTGATLRLHPGAMFLALALAFAVVPLGGCDLLRSISGEPTDVQVAESPELRLAQSELLYQGVLAKVIDNTGPGRLIEPGSGLALRLADANDTAYAALLVARDAVDNHLETSAILVNAAWSAVAQAVAILSREGII